MIHFPKSNAIKCSFLFNFGEKIMSRRDIKRRIFPVISYLPDGCNTSAYFKANCMLSVKRTPAAPAFFLSRGRRGRACHVEAH